MKAKRISGKSHYDGNFYMVFADGVLYTIGDYYTRRLGADAYEVRGRRGEAFVEIPIGDRLANGTDLTQEVYDRLSEQATKTRTFVFV